jgi:menaquinone-dependent protoporphyrinogen oxidase
MTVLIAVSSRHGTTRDIAEVVATQLRKEGIRVAVQAAKRVEDIGRFEAVIIGSAVYMGRWLPEALRFVDERLEALRTKPVWLFSSGPVGDPLKPTVDSPDLGRIAADVGAKGSRTFAGKLDVDDLGLKERIVVKLVGAQQGDFRDWEEIRSWTREIIAVLRPPETFTGSAPAPFPLPLVQEMTAQHFA